MSRKILLIGWDGADWNIINPLLDSGQMPALERLVNNGVISNLATLDPPISPMLWTSIATGKKADKHGILGFLEPDIANSNIRPVNVTSRKVRAIWNILHNQGKKCNVVGWWPSHPAEPINGAMISNFFHKASSKYGEPWEIKEGSVYPVSLLQDISELRVHPGEITFAHLLPFVPELDKIDKDNTIYLDAIAKNLAEAASIQSVTTHLMETTEWDLTAVYFDMIDHFCHGFMKFYPPKMEDTSDELFELLKNVIPSAYKFQDMMLDRLLTIAGEDTTVIIISDHGFQIDKLRPKKLPDYSSAPIHQHNPYGIFCISGENIKKDERIYGSTLLDITPTILDLFELPVGRDMDGKVLMSIYEESRSSANAELITPSYIDSWENVKGEFGMHSPKELNQTTYDYSDEAIMQLVELGYIQKPDEDKGKAIANVVDDSQYNLSRVHSSNRKYESAAEILEKLYHKDKTDIRYNLDLATTYLSLSRYKEAQNIIDNLRKLQTSDLRIQTLNFYQI